jgi:putative SOS response-associated peptidase YedK
MCGRARLVTDYSEIRIELKFDDEGRVPNYAPRWNIAPSQDLLTAVRDKHGKRRPVMMRWGLIPAWAKTADIAFSTFNARAESVDSKPAFRGAWEAGRRCLVVTDGFYEWRKSDPKDSRQPFAVAMAEAKPMVMAGLYEGWVSPEGERLRTVTIITTDANEKIAPIHPRMPVVLAKPDWGKWLGEENVSNAELKAMLRPCPAEAIDVWPVSRLVGNVRNDGPMLVEPVEETAPDVPKQDRLF